MAKVFNSQHWVFPRHYKLFTFAAVMSVVALIVQLLGAHVTAHILLGTSAIIATIPILRDMWKDYSGGSYGIDILALTAIITSVVLHEYWAAIVIVLMLTGGEALEDYAERRSTTELKALLARVPQKAHIIRGKKTLDVPVSQVRVGDRIIIKPGETVPVDAIIIDGNSSFDESSLTGESMPIVKDAGDILLSGSICVDGAITAKATQTAAHSQYQQIIKLVRAASGSQAPFVRLADRYSVPFTIFAFALALGVWFWSGDAIRFLEVIVVATPCPLILAAPIAIISGMSRSAKHGIIVRTGSALEKWASVRSIAFDKTGTLTRGKPVVAEVIPHGNHSKSEILGYAAALEANSTHVLAAAILESASNKNVKFAKARHIREMSGSGLSATIGGKKILVGRLTMLHKYSIEIPMQYMGTSLKQTATYVAIDGKLAGAITFNDEIRPETQSTLNRMKQQGIQHFLMITGDSKTTAANVAKKLGIFEVHAEALPAAKLQLIEHVTDKPVAFVGDGVNDAPVLTAADVGIALGARGSTAASESADIIIMQDSFSHVADSLQIARRTFTIAKQSILIGIGLSVVLMFVFATGKFSPVTGAIVQELVDVFVIFNALRAHTGGKESKQSALLTN